MSEVWLEELPAFCLSVKSEIVFFLFYQLLTLTAFGTIPKGSQIKILYEMLLSTALQCAAPDMSRALCFSCTVVHHVCFFFKPHLLAFISHNCSSKYFFLTEKVSTNAKRVRMLKSCGNLRLWDHLSALPSAESDYHLQNRQSGAC